MPTSFLSNIPQIIQAIFSIKPKTILDIGIGGGKYGLLVREYIPDLEKLDGVEVFEPYITDIQRSIYDEIFIGNILEMTMNVGYDAYLLIDILEHFEKEEGHALLAKLLATGQVVISTPKMWIEQGESDGNIYEIHKTLWALPDFERYNRYVYASKDSLLLTLYK